MNSKVIENNIQLIFENFSKDEFVYDLLIAYGISKTTATRLKKGDFNLSKETGEVLYKKKIFFKEESTDRLFSCIDSFSSDENILKHSPRFIIVTDYETLAAKDLKTKKSLDIPIEELPKYYDFFLPLAGSEVYNTKNDNKADRDAAYKMAELYDNLISINLDIRTSTEGVHSLNLFLSRLLFCFFAEDTGIFEEEGVFTNTLVLHTEKDGSDVHTFLNDLFKRLNTENVEGFPAYLGKSFPHVNGGLFRDTISSPKFNRKARTTLIELGELQWQEINPDIFGSMIQAVVSPKYRSHLGMHYTSVENILKLIKPLFLDELEAEFSKHNANIAQLQKLIFRMSKMKFFDPACGSGNFLIITYKEIRSLEIRILQRIVELLIAKPNANSEMLFTQIHISQFYGIEIDDFAHEMAILSLWLAEHQMNRIFEEQLFDYGRSRPFLPLKEGGKIVLGNSIRLDWDNVCTIGDDGQLYVIGNPPYLGSRNQNPKQKRDMEFIFHKNYGSLDYVSIWFYKGSKYIKGRNAQLAFVSTNSICQGEQVATLWSKIIDDEIEISFAYQSFKWNNNAKSNAGVEVVIIGLRNTYGAEKSIFYDNVKRTVPHINPYLSAQPIKIITRRNNPLCFSEPMVKGCYPTDGGGLLISENEVDSFLNSNLKNNVYSFVGTSEFIKGEKRWCIYLNKEQYDSLQNTDPLKSRIEVVRKSRLSSKKAATRKLAATPYRFEFDSTQNR